MPWRPWLLPAAWLVLALPPQAMAAQSAATFWALNCRGCHSAPPGHRPSQPPGVGQFASVTHGVHCESTAGRHVSGLTW